MGLEFLANLAANRRARKDLLTWMGSNLDKLKARTKPFYEALSVSLCHIARTIYILFARLLNSIPESLKILTNF